ncbi:hypothetical protein ACB092_09G185900, partial [Castanea dentata]
QQEHGSSVTVHDIFGFLIILLLTLLQVNHQNSGNPFETHGATMLLFILAVFVYAIALAGISQPAPNSSYLPILRGVCFISGAFACDSLLMILVPPFGWFIFVLCVCMFLQLLFKSRQQIHQLPLLSSLPSELPILPFAQSTRHLAFPTQLPNIPCTK